VAEKQIRQYTESTTPSGEDDFLLQDTSNLYRKSKIKNFLKRLFTFDDVYDSQIISAFGFAAGGGNKPTLSDFRNGLYLWAFGGATGITEGMFVVNIGHTIKKDTDLTFSIHWTHNISSPTGDIKWNIDYTIARSAGAGSFAAPTTLSSTQTVNAGSQYMHHVSGDMVISGTNIEIEPSTMLICRMWRDADDVADTFVSDAYFINAELHYTKSRTGTLEKDRPYTSAGY